VRSLKYTVVIEPDEEGQGFTVSVPALPGCVTQGETLEEAISMVQDAILLYVSVLVERKEPIPDDVQTTTVQVAA
jgi:antitoxin HicB